MQNVFKIKRALTVPLALDAALLLVLLLIVLFTGGSSLEIGILCIGFIPLLLISLELLIREIRTDDAGLHIKKVLKKRDIPWGEVTHVGVVALNKKIYLVLTTTKGFHVVSNAYEKFLDFVRETLAHVDRERMEEEVSGLIDHPVKRISDIVLSWVAFAVMAGIIFIKLFE